MQPQLLPFAVAMKLSEQVSLNLSHSASKFVDDLRLQFRQRGFEVGFRDSVPVFHDLYTHIIVLHLPPILKGLGDRHFIRELEIATHRDSHGDTRHLQT